MSNPLLPTGMQFPLGTTMVARPPQFPPDLVAKLEEAKQCGRYYIVVVTSADEHGALTAYSCRSTGKFEFKIDWLLRSYLLIWNAILDLAAKAMNVTKPPLDPQAGEAAASEQPAAAQAVERPSAVHVEPDADSRDYA